MRNWGNIPNNVGVQQTQPPRRQVMQFRFAGGMAPPNNANNVGNKSIPGSNAGQNLILTPQKGSFQRLKELIWTERARQLAQQRKEEEIIARAAILKEIANGEGYVPNNFLNITNNLLASVTPNVFQNILFFYK